MGEEEKAGPAPAAVLSRPFYLAHRLATLKFRPAQTRKPQKPEGPLEVPTPPDLEAPVVELPNPDASFEYHRVVNRWLYVFQLQGADKMIWIGEYWVDESGGYHPVDMKLAKGKERNKRPKPARDALKLLSLAYKINGKQVRNAFFLCGARLPLQSVRDLESKAPRAGEKYPPELDFEDLNPDLYQGAPQYHPDTEGLSYIQVTDQLWYTVSWNKVMQQLRDLAIGWIVPAQDLDPQTRRRTDQRAKKKLLSGAIKDLRDGDPNDKLGLKNEFHPYPVPNYAVDGETVMRQWLKDYERTAQHWIDLVEDAALRLVGELDSRRLAFIVKSYLTLLKVDPPGFLEDMPLLLGEYAACVDRIAETGRGSAWIDRVLKDKSHFLHEYTLRQSAPEGVPYQVVRKSTASLLSIWKELPVRYILMHGKDSAVTLVDTLNYITLETLVKDRARITARNLILPNITLPEQAIGWQVKPDGWTPTGARIVHTDVIVPGDHWIKDPKVPKITSALDRVFFVIEIANLVIGVESLIGAAKTKGKSEIAWAAVGVLGSSMDAMTGYGVLAQWQKGTLFKIGGLSAAIDAVIAGRKALEMKDVGDMSAAAGSGVVAGGSALIAAGSAMCLFGASTSWAGAGLVLGIIGGVLVAIGYVISLFTTDTPFELFVAHSVWGARYGNDSGAKPWSAGPFQSWHENNGDGLTRQITAMTNLMAAFTAGGSAWEIWVDLGLAHPQSKIHIDLDAYFDFDGDGKGEHSTAKLVIDLANRRTSVTFPTDQKRSDPAKGTRVTYDKGSVNVVVDMMYFYSGKQPFHDPHSIYGPDLDELGPAYKMDCSVRLDYFGDGTHWVPGSGKPVRFSTYPSVSAHSIDF